MRAYVGDQMVTFQDYLTALKSGIYEPIIKVELLREDETFYKDITDLLIKNGGSLNVQRANGIRSTVDLTFKNDVLLDINPDNIFMRSKFRLWLGLKISGENYWIPQGVFYITDPVLTSNYSENIISIQGVDKFSILTEIGGELDGTYIIPLGTNIISAIKDTLILGGDDIAPIIDNSLIGLTTPYTIEHAQGDKIGDILIELSQLYACSCYYNANGQFVVEKDVDDDIKPSIWDFTTNEKLYMGGSNNYKWSKIYNSVLVVGSNIDGDIKSYKASDTNTLSPTSIDNVGFERVYVYEVDTLDTDQKCQDLAEYILKRKIMNQNELSINSIPMYHLNPDEIITITDSQLNCDKERVIINSFSIPLDNGQMSIQCVKSKEIAFVDS